MNLSNNPDCCPICQHPYGLRRRCYNCQRVDMSVRFWKYVEKTETCWNWIGKSRRQFGYGAINMGGKYGKVIPAHRASWIIHNGAIPEGACVLHHCDNPACVRPDHLFLGTIADNVHDMHQKGRADHRARVKGEGHPKAKLTDEQVLAIRAIYAEGKASPNELASQYGVRQSTIYYIVNGTSWRHLL